MHLVRAARYRLAKSLIAATLVTANVCAMPVATAAGQVWNGKYSLVRYAAEKTGTSLAARQPEPDFSNIYTFVTDCSHECVSTVVDGPKPANPTLPLPPRYTWNGSTWVHVSEWQLAHRHLRRSLRRLRHHGCRSVPRGLTISRRGRSRRRRQW